LLFFISAVLLCGSHLADALTIDDIIVAAKAVRGLINADGSRGPGFVRLSFHDCVGGCDGCINLANTKNNGLKKYIDALETVYPALQARGISRADYWQLANVVALQVTSGGTDKGDEEEQNDPKKKKAKKAKKAKKTKETTTTTTGGGTTTTTETGGAVVTGGGTETITWNASPMDALFNNFKWGRTDCPTAPATTDQHTFPVATVGLDATLASMKAIIGINTRETVALLGAHTLGRTRMADSGYDGAWVPNERTLDNEYYKALLKGWKLQTLSNGKHQWIRNDQTIELNPDMSLAKAVAPDANGLPRESCRRQVNSNGCPDASTRGIVQEYANDNNLWMKDFIAVITKMAAFCPKDATGTCKWTLKDLQVAPPADAEYHPKRSVLLHRIEDEIEKIKDEFDQYISDHQQTP